MDDELFAGVPVRDRDVAQHWYELLLGAPPAFFPNDREAVWRLGPGRYLYVEVRPEVAGTARHAVFVPDLRARLADLAARGLVPAEVERYDGVAKAVFRDPDGNEVGVAGRTAPEPPPAVALDDGTLRLEPLTVAAADEMVHVLASPRLYLHTGGVPPTLEELRARYARQVAGPSGDDEVWLNWVVREDGRAQGHVQATVRRDGERWGADVAWVVGVEAQGRGVATRAGRLLVDHLRAHGVTPVRALVAEGNRASAAVARRLGLRPTAETVDGERVWLLDDAPA